MNSQIDVIQQGDAFELIKGVSDASVDLILCDPVWWEFDQYRFLAEAGARVLKPGGSILAEVGNLYYQQAGAAMEGFDLVYCPMVVEVMTGGNALMHHIRAILMTKPYVWRRKAGTKADLEGQGWMPTMIRGMGKNKKDHKWGDTPAVFVQAVARLTPPGGLVLDPFTGSGVVPRVCRNLGRHFIAFELDQDTAATARKLAESIQMPMFVPEMDGSESTIDLEELESEVYYDGEG